MSHRRLRTGFATLTGVILLTLPAHAGTIASVNFRGKNADRQAGTSGSIAQPGPGVARFLRITGVLQQISQLNSPDDAVVWLQPTSFGARRVGFNPFSLNDTYTNGLASVDVLYRLPTGMSAPNGNWLAVFDVFSDFGSGVDSRWSSITLTLYDGPPTNAADLGSLSAGTLSLPGRIDPGHPRWIRFNVPSDIRANLSSSLVINTLGSALGGGNDTVMTLYNDDGLIVAGSDDAFPDNHLSQLTFGQGGDGDLPAGTYWLAVRAFQGASELAWDVLTTADSGPVNVNITTNVGNPVFCPADVNRSGALTVQDIFDMLAAYFSGCP